MKKLYTLLAAACITGSAFAFTPGQEVKKVNLPEGMSLGQILQKAEATQVSGNKTTFKIVNKADDSEWSCLIALTEWPIFDSIEEFPFYQMVFTCQPRGKSDFYQVNINWPTWGSLDDDCTYEVEGGLMWDRAKVEEKYGDKAFKPYTFEEFQEMAAGAGSSLMIALPGLYYAPCIIGTEAFGQYADSWTGWTVNGNTVYPKSATRTDQGWDYSQACTFDWTLFDALTSDVNITFNGRYTNSYAANSPLAGSTLAELEGAGVVLGFADILWDTLGEVHIFNGGRQEEYTDWSMNYDEQSPVPLNYYYLCFADETMGYMAKNEAGEVVYNYTEKTLPENKQSNGKVLYGSPSYAFKEDAHFTYLAGAIWAPENSEYPYGVWSMKEPEKKNNAYVQMPQAFNLVVAGLPDSYVNSDGFHGCYEGYSQNGIPGEVFVGIGDKKHGLNYKFGSALTNGHYIMGSYTGDIMFHATPDKWISDIKTLPALANEDADVISGPVAVDEIESDAPVVSKTFYNFQGQRLNSEPENGMYIIRAVKADGSVKAIKVAK